MSIVFERFGLNGIGVEGLELRNCQELAISPAHHE
jgi:hypothetical protein